MTACNRGIALVSVLWIVTLLSLVALGMSAGVRSESRMVKNLLSATQAQYAAEGAVDLAVLQLLAPDGDRWPADGSVRNVRIANASVNVAIYDEAGRIDLNFASEQLLDGLLASAGVDAGRRAALVDSIVDWRDPDSLRHLHGAEDDEYSAAGLAYGAKDASFDTVGELGLVLGMQPDILQAIRPALTVFSGRPGIDPAVAPPEVLLAFAGGDTDRVEAYIEQRAAYSGNAGVPDAGFIGGELRTQSGQKVFTIHTEAWVDGSFVARTAATVRLTGGKEIYRVLQWQPAADFALANGAADGTVGARQPRSRSADE